MTDPRIPAVEIWYGTATPGELSAFDQSRAAARDDLRALRLNFNATIAGLPAARERVLARYMLGLMEWEPLHLAMALTEALNELERRDAERRRTGG